MIGVFDSGVGGLFLLKELHKKFPKQSFVYLADKAYFPYGGKSFSFIRNLVKKNIEFLTVQGARQVIVACNTASVILESGDSYPVPVMGVIEPSLRQAEKKSINKKVGLLATVGTVKSQVFLKKAKALNLDLHIYQQACPRLAPFVEQGGWETSTGKGSGINKDKTLYFLLKEYLQPLISKGVDTVIMGCTHYLYLESAIRECIGKNRKVVGPGGFLVKDLMGLKNAGWFESQNKKRGKVVIFINSQDEEIKKQFYQIWDNGENNVRIVVENLKI